MKRKVYAISLLLAFMVMLGHEMFPHHHLGVAAGENNFIENNHKDHSHKHHGHNHTHKNSHEKEKDHHDTGFLLSFPLKEHVHSYHTHNFIPLRSNTFQLSNNHTFSPDVMQPDHAWIILALYPLIHQQTIQPSNNSDPPYFTSYSLRGPPHIG